MGDTSTFTYWRDYGENMTMYLNRTKKNWTIQDYLELARGPKYLPFGIVLPITIVYVIIFITGVLGNSLVCLVIIKDKLMHSATNYYLFSLALSDLMLLVLGLPNDLSVYWQQYPWRYGETFCKVRAVASEMSSYTSVLTIVAFTTERYIAICHPLYSYTMSGFSRVLKIIIGVWVVSFICALPFALFTTVNYIDYPPNSGNILEESAFCAMLESNIPESFPIYELSALLFLVIPMIIIIVLYTKIALRLRERNHYALGAQIEGSVHSRQRHSQSSKSIIRMLIAVVSMFFICWAPFHAQRLLYIYGKSSPYYVTLNEWMYYITGALYFFSSTVNPILYNLMSVRYRKAFRQTLFGKKTNIRRQPQASNRDSTQVPIDASENAELNRKENSFQTTVKSETIVRLNNQNISDGNNVSSVKTGFLSENLLMLASKSVAPDKQKPTSINQASHSLTITNYNTSEKETYI